MLGGALRLIHVSIGNTLKAFDGFLNPFFVLDAPTRASIVYLLDLVLVALGLLAVRCWFLYFFTTFKSTR